MKYAYIRDGLVNTTSEFSDMQWRDGQIVECPDYVEYGWQYKAGEWLEPVVLAAPVPHHSRQITRAAFLRRFHDAEAIEIDLASIGTTVDAAAIRRYLSLVNAAAYVDLDDPVTREGVRALEAVQLIGAGRAAEILDAPVVPGERP